MRLLASVVLLVAACVACGPELPPATPPDPDTSQYERPVAEKIRGEREAVLADPGSAEAWGRLGMTFDAHHLVDQAAACYAEAERLEPENWLWPYMRAVVRFDAPPDEVLGPLLRAHEIEPDIAPLNLRIGLQLLRLDRAEHAERYFRRAHELAPDDAAPLLGLARVALRFGEPEDARIHLERARELSPDHRDIQVLLARVYQQLGRPEQAREAAARATRTMNDTGIVDPLGMDVFEQGVSSFHLGVRGHELLRRGEYAEAIEKLQASIDLNPHDVEVRADLGRALLLGGEVDAGRRELERANRLRPGYVDVDGEIEALRAEGSKQ